ncbi:MAG: DNA-binding protein WhiA, partial [Coriobacteriaceae bacterium]|nr:DNA-binding protein WhiA [Coriobacteriaceae bacterium]
VKNELTRVAPTCSHCDRAVLAALMRVEGSLFLVGKGRNSLEMATDMPKVARLAITLLHSVYHLRTELTMRQSVLHKTPNYLITVPTQPGLQDALADMGIVGKSGLVAGVAPHLVEKRCCQAAYLRGVFMGSGFIANPKGDFHFEMSVVSEELADDIAGLMREREVNARVMQRRNAYLVYLKSGSAISAFLALVGAHQCALALENARVIKSVRNDVNRQVNADMANQAKAAGAAIGQVEAIRKILAHKPASDIPPALRDFMRLRLEHPSASLKELGELADPPLSKSAVYHRVRRIEQMAEEL